ncbi:hypothetical protein [Candidatus Entotheonella palauensis]|uniref:Peptidase C-terminal archaeal/bacterial domain-containing protein n=1 Tax=Candidatus Entotheonella gemina TaxID=1429439 RepID=W4MAP2_9BACT|nr:hypothetical protein [Candidatus Entotheonella palauensis]ETX06712.1 MAG: hypothetical protein ETSY2_15485 [Candidatus Entotheonella gemina]
MTWQLRLGYTALILIAWLSFAMAVTVVQEAGDAGDLPLLGSAQDVTEVELDADGILEIRGSIDGATPDADMYRIEITEPAEFSATSFFVSGLVTIENSQLFLFDENGRGVCANDDNPTLPTGTPESLYAALPQGSCNIPGPGIYYLAVSTGNRDPLSNAADPTSEIFPDEPRQAVVPPHDSNAIVRGWHESGGAGSYLFRLTGINTPPPECGQSLVTNSTDDDLRRYISLDVTDMNGIQSIEVLELNNIEHVEIPEGGQPFTDDGAGGTETTRIFDDSPTAVTMRALSEDKFMHATGRVRVVNTRNRDAICTLVAVQADDMNPPECCYRLILDAEDPIIHVEATDGETGISGIYFDFLRNIKITIPPAFIPEDAQAGQPPPVRTMFDDNDRGKTAFFVDTIQRDETLIIEVTRLDPSINESTAVVRLLDNNLVCNGNDPTDCEPAPNLSGNCDPHIFDIIIPAGRFVERKTISDLTENDHHVVIQNKDPGLTLLALRANEGPLRAHRLEDNEVKSVNTEEDMVEGANDMHFIGIGDSGSEATVIISDRPLPLQTPATLTGLEDVLRPRRQIQECPDS